MYRFHKTLRTYVMFVSDVGANFGFNNTESGWMKGDALYYFVTQHLYPRWLEMKAEFPIVLVVDGYSSHKNTELFIWCKEHDIILLLLYPNSTHILQVLDVGIFGPLKIKYSELFEDWKLLHQTEKFTEMEFIKVLKATNDAVLRSETIINGWRATGLQFFEFANVNRSILLHQSPPDQVDISSQHCDPIIIIPFDDLDFETFDTENQNSSQLLSETVAENQVLYEFDVDNQIRLEIYEGNVWRIHLF